ncbi:DUF6153 family protein [Glycomyces buryatensis]|uniref:Uncharacterized protein n=1 Tax=Glycomyces buryatensis TaxID=2570927 RepID=A0A4S8PUS1_9ACTN|nr:DUF6153 family protein [Glycomyces buryatensis]THV33645.1 hypothetical protein FAB82_26285 [Glycomyces buryatensis]
MDRNRHGAGRLAVCLAVLTAFMTLGHLVGMLGHGDFVHHGHAESAETAATDCSPAETPGRHEAHAEANCGALIETGIADNTAAPDNLPHALAGPAPVSPWTAGELGPNGRAPPERSQLQISRV